MKIGHFTERHLIYVLLLLVLSFPLLRPVGIPLGITKEVRSVWDYIEKLPKGSTVLVSFDVTPAGFAESGPGTVAILRHLLSRDMRVVAVAFADTGPQIFENTMKQLNLPDKKYGEDWVNLGFRAGGEASIAALGNDVLKTFAQDYRGNATAGMPILADIKTGKDFKFFIDVYSNSPGMTEWIRQFTDAHKVPATAVCTANMLPQLTPYVNSKQMLGVISGLRAGAEYELLTNNKGTAVAGMDAQSFAHVFVIGLIALANVQYYNSRKKSEGGAGE